MCGWASFWQPRQKDTGDLGQQVRCIADTLTHRGPNDAGAWVDPEAGLALGFRRLAILDLTADGRQPMHSESGRYVIAFNGEVYNFADLRHQLEPLGHRFRGHSDTEVMLAAIEEWGLQAAVKRFVGMFAFGLWDRQERRLSLVRDPLGIKPLYYGWMGQTFLCGSELKALRTHPAFRPVVDRGALTLYLRYGYVPAPYSIYQGVYKLPPGCMLTLCSPNDRPSPVAYWSAKEIAERGVAQPFCGSEQEAVEQLDCLLREEVRRHMVADVPLGAFLSGGVDSSTVVALMQAQSTQPIKTFTIGSHEGEYNEAVYARAVANHLGTDHTELYVTPAEAQAVIPRLPEIYDEPFADSSQIPTFLVSQLARRQVTVSLSGDGGDELFGGYDRYWIGRAIWQKMRWMPPGFRRSLASRTTSVPTAVYDRWLSGLAPYAGKYNGKASVGAKLHRLAEVLAQPTPEDLYRQLVFQWKAPADVVVGGHTPQVGLASPDCWASLPDFVHRMMLADTITYLPDDILVKVDRASMAVSLEARVPLLDHNVVEWSWSLPPSMKMRDQCSKWILRQVLYNYVPRDLIERPKMGFGVPIGAWLRGPLRDWAESLLSEPRLRNEGFFHPAAIRETWHEHLSGVRNAQYLLWDVLMFQAWLEHCNNVSSLQCRASSSFVA